MDPVRRRLGWAVLLCVLIVPLAASPSAVADPGAQPVVAGLGYPSMFTIAPDGRIFYSEWQTGRIGVFNPADNSIEPTSRYPTSVSPEIRDCSDWPCIQAPGSS